MYQTYTFSDLFIIITFIYFPGKKHFAIIIDELKHEKGRYIDNSLQFTQEIPCLMRKVSNGWRS